MSAINLRSHLLPGLCCSSGLQAIFSSSGGMASGGSRNTTRGLFTLELRSPRRQRDDQVILFGQRHGRLVVPGEYPDLALLAQLVQRDVHPAESLHVTRVNTHADAHAGLGDPDVVGLEVIVQREILQVPDCWG